MVTVATDLGFSREKRLAVVASSANSLLRHLPDKWRSTWSRTRLRQQDLLAQIPVRVRLDCIHDSHDWLLLLLLRFLQRVSWTCLAPDMLALRTDLAPSECSIASVAGSVYAHSNGLLDAGDLSVWSAVDWVKSHLKTLCQLLSPVRINLGSHYLGRLRSICSSCGLYWLWRSDWCWFGGFGYTVWSVNILS